MQDPLSLKPEEGTFSMERFLKQFPLEKDPKKRNRVEEQGETSQNAVKNLKELLKSEEKKLPGNEEAKRKYVDALFLFAQKEQH